ncbi:MAG TPA: hypothetical protein DCF84_06375 [Bacteroidetes bacterium]|nr:hypothetical protein [Bacteroidota bacterium]|tara:strand:+ start:271 stop:876 length:606 start_codon:yes stop_codon:yes gene_type:complete
MSYRHFLADDLQAMPKRQRTEFVQGLSGIKSLFAIITSDGSTVNIAPFNSIIHISSNPARIGYISRPDNNHRHTLQNIITHQSFSINSVREEDLEDVVNCSENLPSNYSEFEKKHIQPTALNNKSIPALRHADVQIFCEYEEHITIPSSQGILVIGRIQEVIIREPLYNDEHQEAWKDLALSQGIEHFYIKGKYRKINYRH